MKTKIKMISNPKYVKEIVTDYLALSKRCDEIDLAKGNKEVQEIVLALKNTIRANEGMLGLSAPQIGYDTRIICLNFNGDIRTFVNPIITNVEGLELSREKCHSIPDKEYIRARHPKISVTYQTPLGKIESVNFVGVAAKIFQHHIDHLDGLLLSDVSLEIDEQFDLATDEERQEVIDMYLDSLDLTSKQLEKEIEEDPEAYQMSQAAKFMNSVESGETVVESVPLTDEEIEHIQQLEGEYKEFIDNNE